MSGGKAGREKGQGWPGRWVMTSKEKPAGSEGVSTYMDARWPGSRQMTPEGQRLWGQNAPDSGEASVAGEELADECKELPPDAERVCWQLGVKRTQRKWCRSCGAMGVWWGWLFLSWDVTGGIQIWEWHELNDFWRLDWESTPFSPHQVTDSCYGYRVW